MNKKTFQLALMWTFILLQIVSNIGMWTTIGMPIWPTWLVGWIASFALWIASAVWIQTSRK